MPPQALKQRRVGIDPRGRHHGHAGTKCDILWRVVHYDLDRHTLDYLYVIAGGVLGRQQRERGARSRLDTVDMTADRPAGIGVDPERDRIARPHAIELDFLEVRRHPDLVRNERGQAGAGLCELAHGRAKVDDAARLSRRYRRGGKIELSLISL